MPAHLLRALSLPRVTGPLTGSAKGTAHQCGTRPWRGQLGGLTPCPHTNTGMGRVQRPQCPVQSPRRTGHEPSPVQPLLARACVERVRSSRPSEVMVPAVQCFQYHV